MIIPEFTGKNGAYWNTDRWAYNLSNELEKSTIKSTFLSHTRKERLSENAKRILNADYLYGGWMEDRSYIWRGSYMEPSKFLHLGNDFVVPVGTEVAATRPCKVLQIYCDTPEEAGWGTRILVKIVDPSYTEPDMHLVYGHLSFGRNTLTVGDNLYPGQIIGYTGGPPENGGWSSHLHLQCVRGDVTRYLEDPVSLDGYGELSQIEMLSDLFPDSIRFADLK